MKGVPDNPRPVIAIGEVGVGSGSASIPYTISWPGNGKSTCSTTLEYGFFADDLRQSVALGSGKIGRETAGMDNLLPGRIYYFSIKADNGTCATNSTVTTFSLGESEPFPSAFTPGMPVIAGVGAGCVFGDGETAAFSGTFAQYANGTVVKLHCSTDGVDWVEAAATVTADGFSGTIGNLLPDTTYQYYLTAEAGDFIDRTPTKTFYSRGAAVLSQTISVSNPTRQITVSGSLSDVGAGGRSTLRLYVRIGGVWTAVATSEVTQAGAFALVYDGTGVLDFGSNYACKVTVENTSNGGRTWTGTSSEQAFDVVDTLTYTWNVPAGEWSESANWTPSSEAVGRAGYPVPGSTARFAASAVTRLSGAACAQLLQVPNAGTVRFEGMAADSRLTVNAVSLPASGGVLELGGVAVPTLAIAGAGVFPGTNCERVTLAVDRKARFLRTGRRGEHLVLSAAGGIETNAVEFAAVYHDVGAFRYVWPASDPTCSGRPVEVWLDTVPMKGLAVILR